MNKEEKVYEFSCNGICEPAFKIQSDDKRIDIFNPHMDNSEYDVYLWECPECGHGNCECYSDLEDEDQGNRRIK